MTFDTTESDLSGSVGPPVQRGDPAVPHFPSESLAFLNAPPSPPPSALAESLQLISAQLNSVLSALDSLNPRQGASPYASFRAPLPAQPRSNPAARTSLGKQPPTWSWAPPSLSATTPLYSNPITSELRPSEELLSSRWSQIFPGMAANF